MSSGPGSTNTGLARPGERFTVRFADGHTTTASWWREDLHLETGTALAVYADGLLKGRAAIVANAYGSGRVVYVATLLEETAFAEVLLEEVRAAGVESPFPGVPAQVECVVRADEREEYLFLLNHDAERTAAVPLTGRGTDLLTGTRPPKRSPWPPRSRGDPQDTAGARVTHPRQHHARPAGERAPLSRRGSGPRRWPPARERRAIIPNGTRRTRRAGPRIGSRPGPPLSWRVRPPAPPPSWRGRRRRPPRAAERAAR
ncbi:beta-galactosidase trimerization domain-containing protein [Streptosporangium lutulentum]